MKPVIIFGNGKIAEVIAFQMTEYQQREIAAFTVDKEYIDQKEFCGKPIVAFEEVEKHYSVDEYECFVAIGYQDLNQLRADKIAEAEEKGYLITSFVHQNSGSPTDLSYGKNCFIMHNVNIHPCVKLGDNVFVWSGSMIGHHCKIGNHNWFTSSSNIGGNVTIGNYNFFAMNTTVNHSLTLGNYLFLGANTLINRNMKDLEVIISEADKPIKLNSKQFLKFSNFNTL